MIKDEIFYFLNIETGELEYITNGEFDQFVEILLGDINYFTGSTLIQKYSDIDKEMLSQGYRLSPIKPFVLGGEYVNQNLFLNKYIDNLELNSSIALQIYGLPDGQKVIIEKI
ncbi:MAG: hypothetical protein IPJ13_32070 [Saprospiraceae bacterium]|nr:hypothetical protein [Saprospiraceae bacterium]MBK9564994.1 hypothetical protein [Saprospiraceae bacterium]MBP6445489.1 hypothetical protein [Saprospiraceae bacterium]